MKRIAWILLTLSACVGPDLSAEALSGEWRGTTSGGQPISFTVDPRGVTRVTLQWRTAGCSGTTTIRPGMPYEITDGEFETSGLDISGTFTSETEAEGTFRLSDSQCGSTSGTWSADR